MRMMEKIGRCIRKQNQITLSYTQWIEELVKVLEHTPVHFGMSLCLWLQQERHHVRTSFFKMVDAVFFFTWHIVLWWFSWGLAIFSVPGRCEKDRWGTSEGSIVHQRKTMNSHGCMILLIVFSSLYLFIKEFHILQNTQRLDGSPNFISDNKNVSHDNAKLQNDGVESRWALQNTFQYSNNIAMKTDQSLLASSIYSLSAHQSQSKLSGLSILSN